MSLQRAQISAGRITYSESFPVPMTGEIVVLTVPADDWRDALDVFVTNNGSLASGGLVRVYAITRGARVEVSRGRVSKDLSASSLVGRVRGVACERYEVTYTRDASMTDASDPTLLVVIAACLYGIAPTTSAEPITRLYRFSGGQWQVSDQSSNVYSVAASNASASDAWLWLFDKKAVTPAAGLVTDFPPVYLPPNGKGVGAVDFGARAPYPFALGLYFDLSTSPFTYTPVAGAPGGTFHTLIEFA
jgi:hypothetical protein